MKNILFIAPPAAGKGTQSDLLVKNFGYVQLSAGDLLRNIDRTTSLGQKVEELISKGIFVSDEMILELFKNNLKKLDGKPFILDGCPRNVSQAEKMDEILKELHLNIDVVITMDAPYEVLLERTLARLNCPNCKSTYNKLFKPPIEEGICDNCGKQLMVRSDDIEDSFKTRYETYKKMTEEPLLDYYKKQNKVVRVDALDNTYNAIVSVLKR